jgi:hypothetical protein
MAHAEKGRFLLSDCFGRANGCAGAAAGAGILIDFIFALAFFYCGNGALLGAGAAGYTIIIDGKCHGISPVELILSE